MRRNIVLIIILLAAPLMGQKASLTNFSAGEVTPRVFGRPDATKFYSGVRLLENMFVKPLGPVQKRSGTYYVATAAGEGRLVAFDAEVGEGIVLEFTNERIRFYKDN